MPKPQKRWQYQTGDFEGNQFKRSFIMWYGYGIARSGYGIKRKLQRVSSRNPAVWLRGSPSRHRRMLKTHRKYFA